MAEKDEKIREIYEALNENILAVKSTLELVEASVEEDYLCKLAQKALGRMDAIHKMTDETFALLKACIEKMGNAKS
jgi:hypothetical protein